MPDPLKDPSEALDELETRLRSWQPSPAGLSRDRLLFEAGRAAAQQPGMGRGGAWRWQLATVAATILALGFGLGWHRERLERRAIEVARNDVGSPVDRPEIEQPLVSSGPAEKLPPDPCSYFVLVRQFSEENADPGHLDRKPRLAPALPRSTPPAPRAIPMRPRDFNRVIAL
jgi:hypothetical protein